LAGKPDAVRLRSSTLRSFGKYGYGIYVLHVIFVQIGPALFYRFSLSALTFQILMAGYVPLMIACSYGCAWLSYECMEKRVLALKKYFAD